MPHAVVSLPVCLLAVGSIASGAVAKEGAARGNRGFLAGSLGSDGGQVNSSCPCACSPMCPCGSVQFSNIIIHNKCAKDLYLNGRTSGTTDQKWVALPHTTSQTYRGGETYLPMKFIGTSGNSQRIEVCNAPGPPTSACDDASGDLMWIEMSTNLQVSPNGGFQFDNPPALNFATQQSIGDVGMEVGLLQKDQVTPIVDRSVCQSSSLPSSKARFQGTSQGCVEATAQQKSGKQGVSSSGAQICLATCPGTDATVPFNPTTTGSECEACTLSNYVEQTEWGDITRVKDGQFNAYAQYGSDNACVWTQGKWVSGRRTVTTREDYPNRQREYNPSGIIPYIDIWHGSGMAASPNFECWDKYGTGPEGFPLLGTSAEWDTLDTLEVTFCPEVVQCERPLTN